MHLISFSYIQFCEESSKESSKEYFHYLEYIVPKELEKHATEALLAIGQYLLPLNLDKLKINGRNRNKSDIGSIFSFKF